MAVEVVGAVVSGFSILHITGEVFATGLKLKQLVDEVNDIPQELSGWTRQLDVVESVLRDVDPYQLLTRSRFEVPQSTSLQKAWNDCGMRLKDLRNLLDGLSEQLEPSKGRRRRKMAATRIALKRDTLSRRLQELRDAIQILTLAQQSASM